MPDGFYDVKYEPRYWIWKIKLLL